MDRNVVLSWKVGTEEVSAAPAQRSTPTTDHRTRPTALLRAATLLRFAHLAPGARAGRAARIAPTRVSPAHCLPALQPQPRGSEDTYDVDISTTPPNPDASTTTVEEPAE
eukprot:5823380-Prymnesium_polylepis.1